MNWKISVYPTRTGWRVRTKHDGCVVSALIEKAVVDALTQLQRKLDKVAGD